MSGSWKNPPISFYSPSGSSSICCFVTCLCLGSGFILVFLFSMLHWGVFLKSWGLGLLDSVCRMVMVSHMWKLSHSGLYYNFGWPKVLVRLRKFIPVCSHFWSVRGLLYLLPLLCFSPRWEVGGLWEEEEWCNQGWEGWSDHRGRPGTMQWGRGRVGAWLSGQDNRLCAAVQGSRKLLTVTQGRVLLWGCQQGSQCVC